MLRLRDIMRTDVVTVDPELSLRDAMELFSEYHVSGAPVVSGDQVVGVISASDLLTFESSLPSVPQERATRAEWREGAGNSDGSEEDESSSTFYSDYWEDADTEIDERFNQAETKESDRYAEHTVSEAMSSRVCSFSSSTPVELAAETMRKDRIHRVLVMDGGVLLGIVTTSDITRAVAEHKLTNRTYVFGKGSRAGTHGWP